MWSVDYVFVHFRQEWYATYISHDTKTGRFVAETDKVMVKNSKEFNAQVYWTWDQLAMAVVLNKDIIMETKQAEATVDLHDMDKRGMMIVDWNSNNINMTIVTKVDQEKFDKEIHKAVL